MDKFMANVLLDAGEHSGHARKTDRKRDRKYAKAFCRNWEKIGADDALEDADYCSPVPTYRWEPSDYLSPLNNWLASKVGQKWDKIHSEISHAVDRNSMVGDHLWEHVRGYVSEKPTDTYRRYSNFVVDEEGILQKGEYVRPKYRSEKRDLHLAQAWVGHEKIAVSRIFVNALSGFQYREETFFIHRLIRISGKKLYWMTPVREGYRQGKRLSKEEEQKFHSFSKTSQEFLTWTPDRRPQYTKRR